jgi:hypothetical protein
MEIPVCVRMKGRAALLQCVKEFRAKYLHPMKHLLITFLILGSQLLAADGQRFDLSKRASEIDPQAKEHPEINPQC